jgi:hypothetical protein
MCLRESLFFASLKSLKKGVGSRVGSGSGSRSISQRYGSGSAPKCHGSPTLMQNKQKNFSQNKKLLYIPQGCCYLAGQAGCLGEHVEVARGEGERHRLVHLDCDRLLCLHANILNNYKIQTCESRFMESGSAYGSRI